MEVILPCLLFIFMMVENSVSDNASEDDITESLSGSVKSVGDIAENVGREIGVVDEENDVCYPQTGCFSQRDPWVTLKRPFPKPESPEKIQVGFYLMTRNTWQFPVANLTVDSTNAGTVMQSLRTLDYQPNRQMTVFITHGFDASIQSEWMAEMAQAYLSRVDANVFLVDWEKGATDGSYLQVAANTRVVGVLLAKLILLLVQSTYLNPNNIHMVGHSLGGHICGYAGKIVPGIYRITALDLAQPGFEGSNERVRLHKSDAQNVDAIHTNAKPTVPLLGLGYISPVGDVDFYFNGGAHQPGCIVELQIPDTEITTVLDLMKLPVAVISKYLSCSHSMSTYYFVEALQRQDCVIWGIKDNILMGTLNVLTLGRVQRLAIAGNGIVCALQTCSPVGLNTFQYPGRGKFQAITRAKAPYCIADETVTQSMYKQLTQANNPLSIFNLFG